MEMDEKYFVAKITFEQLDSETGKIKNYRIRSKEEANWEKRKYLLWLASNDCPEQDRGNLLYKLPSDVSRMVIGFV